MRAWLIVALLSLVPCIASAEIQKGVPEVWPSKHELSAHLGYHLSFGGQVGDPHGMTLNVEYAYRFHPLVWFDVGVNQLFGFGAKDGACLKNAAALCYRGGWMTGLNAGVKLKFVTKIPLVVEVPILLGVQGMYNRECGDDGASVPVVRTGVGIKYFLKPRIGIGLNVHGEFGPAFHDATACKGGGRYTDFYGAVDFLVGAEFIL